MEQYVYSPYTHSWREQEKMYLFISGNNNNIAIETQRVSCKEELF